MINDVYLVVKNMLNENGRGIFAPDRFVSYSKAAQIRVFGNVIDWLKRAKEENFYRTPKETVEMLEVVEDIFITPPTSISRWSDGALQKYHTLPDDFFKFDSAFVEMYEIMKEPMRKMRSLERSTYSAPTFEAPVCFQEGKKMWVLPEEIGRIDDEYFDQVEVVYVRYPKDPNWTFINVSGSAVFNESDPSYQDFELPNFLFNELVVEILAMAGLRVRAADVVQYADRDKQIEFNKDEK